MELTSHDKLRASAAAERADFEPNINKAMALSQMVAVGAVSDRSARLWLRTRATGPFTVEVWAYGGETMAASVTDCRMPGDDGTMAFTLPDDTPAIGALHPATEYRYRITVSRTGDLVGEGRFETAPVEGARGSFAFAFMSCHQPFRSDGYIHPDSARMLAALCPALETRGVKYTLLIGDQIYADAANAGSVLGAHNEHKMSIDEIRNCYQACYRRFWLFPEMLRFQARWPTWRIWDDHEIANDWGTRSAHLRPEWRRVFEGARHAFIDYQASRTMIFGSQLPSAFYQ